MRTNSQKETWSLKTANRGSKLTVGRQGLGFNVLLVEDELDDQFFVRRALEDLVPTVDLKIAGDGASALAYLCENRTTLPDLVLLDLKLPKMSGIEVLKRIGWDSSMRSVPIVVLSSSSEPRDVDAALASGARECIQKSTAYEMHRATIRGVITKYAEIAAPKSA